MRTIVFVLALLSSSSLFSQNVKEAKFSLKNQNYVYVGVKTPIVIYDFGKKDSLVAPDNVKVIKESELGHFSIIVTKNVKDFELKILNKKGKQKSTVHLTSVLLPSPRVTLFGKVEGLLSAAQLRTAEKLTIEYPCAPIPFKVRIVSFKVVTTSGRMPNPSVKNGGDLFNAKSRMLLAKVERGSRVYIEDIRVRMPDGQIRKIPSLVFKVK